MLNDYEIKKHPRSELLRSVFKLFFSLLVLYSATLFVPALVLDVQSQHERQAESLKIRVVANSSSESDQQFKQLVVENIQAFVKNNVNTVQNDKMFEQLQTHLQEKFPNDSITMKTGDNLLPPKFQFHTFYPQNFHNSVIFVIGGGRGENWFCSVFPTVCERSDQQEKSKTKFLIYEWIKEKSG
ncbi:stage II sporulation protein R [Solibacillus sp. FSL H8-0538]|uniref:stage II sporulation protein R n=1 Tax=Solibacillus sp. FSL H8-0538 TaxID=2921400 RepID=UPI0030F74023